jgi:hypothetical protein
MNPKLITAVILGTLAIFVGGYFLTRPTVSADPTKYDGFAQCIAEKKLTMYGAYWCPHCQNEKKAFGESFKYVPYIECTQQTDLCLEKGVNGYPTWIADDGTRYEGEQGLEGLAKITSCQLP